MEMKFMAAADLGQNWKWMAKSPILFCIDDDGNPFQGRE